MELIAKKPTFDVNKIIAGIKAGEMPALAQAITLIESNLSSHRQDASSILRSLPPPKRQTIRIGITGIPGCGKSTLIESLGLHICEQDNHRVAVLTIDPSSPKTGGSILADKTRMNKLSNHPNCFIRPSPSGGRLGGVAAKTYETIQICESAGYNVIIIETVGVGQGEAAVRNLCDFFLLLTNTGGGDSLQTIKRGVIELADSILVTKADGDNLTQAQELKSSLNLTLKMITSKHQHWQVRADISSTITGLGIKECWENIKRYIKSANERDEIVKLRQEQEIKRFDELVSEGVKSWFFEKTRFKAPYQAKLAELSNKGGMATLAAEELLKAIL